MQSFAMKKSGFFMSTIKFDALILLVFFPEIVSKQSIVFLIFFLFLEAKMEQIFDSNQFAFTAHIKWNFINKIIEFQSRLLLTEIDVFLFRTFHLPEIIIDFRYVIFFWLELANAFYNIIQSSEVYFGNLTKHSIMN